MEQVPPGSSGRAAQDNPRETLFQMITAYRTSRMIHAAAMLGLADRLRDGPQSTEVLADVTGMHAPSLYRLLRALASLGIFAEDDQGRFELTPLSQPLRSDVEGSAHPVALFFGAESQWRSWENLLYSIATGETAFRHVYGMDPWEYRASRPELSAAFDSFMTFNTAPQTAAIVAAYDFSWAHTVVDVAGGRGTLIAGILRANLDLRGILCDAPLVVAEAQSLLEAAGVLERCRVEACDFFASLPSGGDLYILKSIIHDWDDERAEQILRNCRRVMPPDGRLLLIENLIPPGNDPHRGKITDMQMLLELGGRERSESEYAALLAGAGFQISRVVPTGSNLSIIEAQPE